MIPCLRKFGIRFAAYCPLAYVVLIASCTSYLTFSSEAGFLWVISSMTVHLTRWKREAISTRTYPSAPISTSDTPECWDQCGRCAKSWCVSVLVIRHFHLSISTLRSHSSRQQEKHGLNLNQASVRWLQHHSAMIPSDLGIIFGGSKPSHIDKTLEYKSVY